MNLWNNYYLARTVPEALQTLANAPGPAQVVAGGTDLLLDIQQGRHSPVHTLVDITTIPEMTCLEIRQDRLFIGASLPLNQVVAHPLVSQHARALQEAAGLIGGPQVRNTATLGGNVGHALPAGDGTIALMALDALAEVASLEGRSLRSLKTLFQGPGQSALDQRREMIVGFYLPLQKTGQASAFRRVMRPQGVAIAILNLAVWLQRQGDEVADLRLAVGPSGPTPQRAFKAEEVLKGRPVSEAALIQAQEVLLSSLKFRTSPFRATGEYRQHVACVLLKETLETAWKRALPEPVLGG